MNVQDEKKKIKQLATPRVTTIRVRQILSQSGIVMERWQLWEWLKFTNRMTEHDAEIIAAYWQAIRERTEKFNKLVAPEKQRAMNAAKKLAAMAASN